MAESAEQIRKHIATLEEFERQYEHFIDMLESSQLDSDYPEQQRRLTKLAARADQAIKASGVGGLVTTHPPAIGGAIKSADLPSQIFDYGPIGLDESGFGLQRAILERLPAQIAGLEMKLEGIESREAVAFGPPSDSPVPAQPTPTVSIPQQPWEKRPPGGPKKRPWHEHPLVLTVVGGLIVTVVGGIAVALILGNQ